MSNASTSSRTLLCSIVLATFSASLFWTGFPVFIQRVLGSKYSLSEVYAFAVSGSFAFSLIAGIWADRSRYRQVSVLSQLASAILIAGIAALCFWGLPAVGLFALPFLYLNFALGNVMESVWLFEKLDSGEVAAKILNRNLALTGAKLVGFALGPILFGVSGFGSLLTCVAAFAIASLIQWLIQKKNQPASETIEASSAGALKSRILKNPGILAAGILIGFLSVPLNPIFAARALQLMGDFGASVFWMCAGLSSIGGMLALKRFKMISWPKARWPATIVMSMAVAIALVAEHAALVIGAASLYIFFLPLFSIEFQSRILRDDLNQHVGGKVGLINASVEGGIFLGMCASAVSAHLGALVQLAGIIALIILRLVILSLPEEKLASSA